jgi:hypothetical protein
MSSNSEDNNMSNQMMEEDDVSKIVPQRLMEILSDRQYNDSISWLPHGRAFFIKNRKLFGETVMPRYFSRKAKYRSFTRRLNRWYVQISLVDEMFPNVIREGGVQTFKTCVRILRILQEQLESSH